MGLQNRQPITKSAVSDAECERLWYVAVFIGRYGLALDSAQKGSYHLGLPLPGPAEETEPRRGIPYIGWRVPPEALRTQRRKVCFWDVYVHRDRAAGC